MSPCEAVRERGIKVLTPDEIEVSRKVCRVSVIGRLGRNQLIMRERQEGVRVKGKERRRSETNGIAITRGARYCRFARPTRYNDRRARPDMSRRVHQAGCVPVAFKLCKVSKEYLYQCQRGHLPRTSTFPHPPFYSPTSSCVAQC